MDLSGNRTIEPSHLRPADQQGPLPDLPGKAPAIVARRSSQRIFSQVVHSWVIRYSPELLERFNARKRAVTGKWHVDEAYVRVRGQWRYPYRAIDSNGDTVEFWFSERRNLTAAKRFLRKVLKRQGRPERIVIAGAPDDGDGLWGVESRSPPSANAF